MTSQAVPTWRLTCARKDLPIDHPDKLAVVYVECLTESDAIAFAGDGWESVRVDRVPTLTDAGASVHEQLLERVAP